MPASPKDRAIRYAISNRKVFPELTHRDYLRRLFAVPSDIVQLREKDLGDEMLDQWVQLAVGESQRRGRLLLVNSPPGEGLREGVQGVHLTSRQGADLWLEPRPLILGKSVHSRQEARQAQEEGVDYVLLGPIFAPLSKTASVPPLGLEELALTARDLRIPVLALGGTGPWNEDEVMQTGAAGFAGISWVHREMLD